MKVLTISDSRKKNSQGNIPCLLLAEKKQLLAFSVSRYSKIITVNARRAVYTAFKLKLIHLKCMGRVHLIYFSQFLKWMNLKYEIIIENRFSVL